MITTVTEPVLEDFQMTDTSPPDCPHCGQVHEALKSWSPLSSDVREVTCAGCQLPLLIDWSDDGMGFYFFLSLTAEAVQELQRRRGVSSDVSAAG